MRGWGLKKQDRTGLLRILDHTPRILGNLEGLKKKWLSFSGYCQENKQEGAKETGELKRGQSGLN